MGMDVYGKKPRSEEGKYFRANIWWWHPLATYCEVVSPKATSDWAGWHHNDGEGLGDEEAQTLAALLEVEIESGRCAKYAAQHTAQMNSIPAEPCPSCEAKGCERCEGKGKVKSMRSWYSFDVDNVREFASFLKDCGGFEIH